MAPLTISSLIGSSDHRAIADDALKDEDNAAWVMHLDPVIQQIWVEHIYWIRLIDRLAEQDWLYSQTSNFQLFWQEWKGLYRTGELQPGVYQDLLTRMRHRWLEDGCLPRECPPMRAWNQYLRAIARYHTDPLKIDTLEQFTRLLINLGGSFFQVFPLLPARYRSAARYLGALDQCYNILRDLAEDAEQGICYLPTEALQHFGLSQSEILNGNAFDCPEYKAMMQFWLTTYLPALRQKSETLLLATDLPPSWRILRDWCLHRYSRIETVLQRCSYDFTEFPAQYWAEVRRELPVLRNWVRQLQPTQASQVSWCTSSPARNAYTQFSVIVGLASRLHHNATLPRPALHPTSKCLI